jgi:hypothetical protein
MLTRLDFHPYEGSSMDRRLIHNEIRLIFPQNPPQGFSRRNAKASAGFTEDDILALGLFIDGKTFFSDGFRQKVATIVDALYRRLARDPSGDISPEKLDEVEKRARIKAIENNLQSRQTDTQE